MFKTSVILPSLLAVWTLGVLTTAAPTPHNENDIDNFRTSIRFGSPLIHPYDDDITLKVDSNFTLRCQSNVPVTWHVPVSIQSEFMHFSIESSRSDDQDRPFESVLHLRNINHYFVGFYYCIKEQIEPIFEDDYENLIQSFNASRIYIFVDDPENLIVPVESPVATVVQYTHATIPCKPTSKDVQVELLKDDEESHHIESAAYDPRIGFTLKFNHLSDGGGFKCKVANDTSQNSANNEFDYHIDILSNSPTEFINKPTITSKSGNHATQGGQLVLDCSIELALDVMFSITWKLPHIDLKDERVAVTRTTQEITNTMIQIGRSTLTVRNVDRDKDQGLYSCIVMDHSKKTSQDDKLITIFNPNEGYINMSEPSGHYVVTTTTNKSAVQWIIRYTGHPRPIDLTWFDNKNEEITNWSSPDDKYDIKITDYDCVFRIKHIELRDSGVYTLRASNGYEEKILNVTLVVEEKPSVLVKDAYVMMGQEARLICYCAGYPESEITWKFTPCKIEPKWPTCDKSQTMTLLENIRTISLTSLSQETELRFTPEHPGKVTCHAKNLKGSDTSEALLIVGDLNEPLSVWGVDADNKIAIGDEFSIDCGALVYNYTGPLYWYRDKNMVINDDNIDLIDSHTDYSYRKKLTWKSITKEDAGTYECHGNLLFNDSIQIKEIDFQVYDPVLPSLDETNFNDYPLSKNLGESLRLECVFSGIPKPKINWYKDDVLMQFGPTSNSTIQIYDDGTVFNMQYIKPEDEGIYKCEGVNKLGAVSKEMTIKIADMPGIKKEIIIGVIVFMVILIIIFLFLCIWILRAKRILREMKAAGLANFEEGSPECINPSLALDEQADLLPYDKNFEFPREKLKLGKQLGAGAFGIVVKGVAQGILPYEEETTVAVKMVKKNTDNEVMRALISELKIMVHLGQHLNVVNLLGAVTKNIAKRDVMVIVEYCRFGNVQNFLLKHREFFIDQINPETDEVDSTITALEQRWSNDSGYEYNSKGDEKKMSMGGKFPGDPSSHINSKGYMRHSAMDTFAGGLDTCNTEATLISNYPDGGEDNMILSNNSVQPGWRSNYRMDYKGPARTVTTSDLICWGFQVARGMEYLASRRVLHGDLAARNILLCDDNVVKICDFGLAKSMYKSENYKKQGEAKLPVKWLALESISDHVFSTYTDIWSFGIVLWEFFSLAKVPYPGMDADQMFLKLRDGYRMDKPQFANQNIYDIMLQCWSAKPELRPSFTELEKRLSSMLQDAVREHYVDLNEPYLQMNTEYMKTGQRDYLAMMGPPEGEAPATPNYVNGNNLPKDQSTSDYLCMSPKSGSVIFSPRATTASTSGQQHFDFSSALNASPTLTNNLDTSSPNNQQKIRKKPGLPEEIPMLKKSNNNSANISSDSESELSPDAKSGSKKFTNLNEPEYKNIISSADNYVNVPSTFMGNKYNSKDAFSNPTYVSLGKTQ